MIFRENKKFKNIIRHLKNYFRDDKYYDVVNHALFGFP